MELIKGVWLFTNSGDDHARHLEFFGRTLARTLEDLGHPGDFIMDELPPYAAPGLWVVLGAHLNPSAFGEEVSARCIIYNTADPTSDWMTPAYRMLLKRARAVWNYYPLPAPADDGVEKAVYVPPALHDAFVDSSQRAQTKSYSNCPIDVLFVGPSDRRCQAVLDEMVGLHQLVVARVSDGWRLPDLIHASKICLNMHRHDSKIFDAIRVQELVSRRAVVLSEQTTAGDSWPVEQAPYGELAKRAWQICSSSSGPWFEANERVWSFTRTMHADVVRALGEL